MWPPKIGQPRRVAPTENKSRSNEMPRVKRGPKGKNKRKAILKLAKGFYSSRRIRQKTAMETIDKGLNYAFRDRKVRKREFRALWITRINAAVRMADLSYSKFIAGLKKGGVDLDRKVLADLCVNDPAGFSRLVTIAKENIQ